MSSRFANSDKDETKDLNTSSFDDMVLASADIDGDPDKDGLSNMEEFLRGSDPNSKYSGSSDTTDVSWGAVRPTIALTSESVSEPTSSDVVIALTDLPDKAVTVQLDYWPKGFEAQLRTTDPVPVKGATTSSSKGASGRFANVRLSGLKASTEYVFKAIAFDALGVPSTPSGEVSFKTAAADAPAPPAPVDPENPNPSSGGGGCDIGATHSMALLLLAPMVVLFSRR